MLWGKVLQNQKCFVIIIGLINDKTVCGHGNWYIYIYIYSFVSWFKANNEIKANNEKCY